MRQYEVHIRIIKTMFELYYGGWSLGLPNAKEHLNNYNSTVQYLSHRSCNIFWGTVEFVTSNNDTVVLLVDDKTFWAKILRTVLSNVPHLIS